MPRQILDPEGIAELESVAWLGLILGVGGFLQLRWSHDRYAAVSSDQAAAVIVQAWCLGLAIVSALTALDLATGQLADRMMQWVVVYFGLAAMAVFLALAVAGRIRGPLDRA